MLLLYRLHIYLQVPMLGVTLDVVIGLTVIAMSVYNLCIALSIILTSGVGKNGSTVAVSLPLPHQSRPPHPTQTVL